MIPSRKFMQYAVLTQLANHSLFPSLRYEQLHDICSHIWYGSGPSLYGALGGAVFGLIGMYFAFLVEKAFMDGSGLGTTGQEGYIFGDPHRLLAPYGQTIAANAMLRV